MLNMHAHVSNKCYFFLAIINLAPRSPIAQHCTVLCVTISANNAPRSPTAPYMHIASTSLLTTATGLCITRSTAIVDDAGGAPFNVQALLRSIV